MKTIIETDDTDLAGLQFEKDGKLISWEDLSQAEQMKILNAFAGYYKLYSKFISTE